MAYAYRLYGVLLHSEIPLPEIAVDPLLTDPQVMIRCASIDPHPPILDGKGLHFSIADSQTAYITAPDHFVIQVRGGCEMTLDLMSGIDASRAVPAIMGAAMGLLLYQRGLCILHGSAVAIHNSAVGFVGHKGQGKSVMAASFHQHGCPIIADDIIAIDPQTLMVYPVTPQVRLWPDAVAHFGQQAESLPLVHPAQPKRYWRMSSVESTSYRLEHIFVLAHGQACEIQPLTSFEAFSEMLRYSYASRWLSHTQPAPAHFAQCTALASQVPVSRLRRPKDLSLLHHTLDLVEQTIAHSVP